MLYNSNGGIMLMFQNEVGGLRDLIAASNRQLCMVGAGHPYR